MYQIKAAIFDADGTLLNSMHIWNELGERYLKSLNIEPEKNLSQKLYFMTLEQSSEYLNKKYELKNSPSEIKNAILKIIENFYVYEVGLKSGVKKFLENLPIPKVIATSGDKNLLKTALKRNEIDKYFDEIFTCSDLNTTKHEAKIFMRCSEYLKVNPKNTAVFEDALFSIRTAGKAGFITVGIEDSSNIFQREELIRASDFYISDFDRKDNHENIINCCGQ